MDLAGLPSVGVAVQEPAGTPAAPPIDLAGTSIPRAARAAGVHPPSTAPPALL
jgi:hypothetical protein